MSYPVDELEVARLWDENADLWIRQVRSGHDRFREVFNNPMFLAFLPDIVGLQILDLGCGEGHNTRVLARRGALVTAIDISPRLIQAAEEEERREPLGIKYALCSFTTLAAFDNEAFDAAVSTMALMDGPNFSAVAREVHRTLRKGGGFYFSVTHPCFMTRESGWLKDHSGDVTGWRVAKYWEDDSYVERWGFSAGADQREDVFTIRYFPHRLEDYINGLCDAGFRIVRMGEPRPTPEMVDAHSRLAPFRSHIAHSLYLGAVKVA
jgi:SAM-dependent methyltransferase